MLGALAAGTPVSMLAQARVQGVLFDSLRTGAPIASAEVVLAGTGLRTRTDRAGRFRFDAVPAGEHRVAFWAAWLDSLAVPALEAVVSVPSGGGRLEVRLATPSEATLQMRHCGTTLEPAQGLLVGELRSIDGAPQAGVEVRAQWTETTIGARSLATQQRASVDTTTLGGFYALCGTPRDAEVTLVATRAGGGSGQVIVALGAEPVRRRDLVVAASGDRGRLSGRVLREDGAGLAGATIVAIGDSSWSATTDAEGRFSFDAFPHWSSQLLVRSLGFQPQTVDVDPSAAAIELEGIRLVKNPFELSRVTVDGRVMSESELGFEQRRKVGMGSFMDSTEIASHPRFSARIVGNRTPRSRVTCNSILCTLWLTRGNDPCKPRLFVDGHPADSGAGDQDFWLQRAVRIEVYRAAHAPPKFNDFDGCGALVIWTR